jgi:hypothetical protein
MMNNHGNNNLMNGYKKFVDSNVPFKNNPILSGNAMFRETLKNQDFKNRVNMSKIEQMKKIKSVKDLNMTTEQITNYVIAPIKIEKMDKRELNSNYESKKSAYSASDKVVPKQLKELWEGRQNTPYKNILKKENYKKDFKTKDDLLVHKYTQLDRDKIKLESEYDALITLLEYHNSELLTIYSASEQTKHKENFDYVLKYKNLIEYDPKNYSDLKKYYKKTQKKINKENKRIDEMIELLISGDDLTKDELEQIQKEADIEDQTNDREILNIIVKSEKKLEKQLEKQLIREIGKDSYNQLMEQFTESIDKKVTMRGKKKEKEQIETQKVLCDIPEPVKSTESEKQSKKKLIINKKIETTITDKTSIIDKTILSNDTVGHIDSATLEKYKNRKLKTTNND